MESEDKRWKWNKLEENKVDEERWEVSTGAWAVVKGCRQGAIGGGAGSAAAGGLSMTAIFKGRHHQLHQLFLQGNTSLLLLQRKGLSVLPTASRLTLHSIVQQAVEVLVSLITPSGQVAAFYK